MEHIDYAYTHGMDDADVEARLRSAETGVLALSRENDAYAVPLAHYYDGDGLYLRLGTTAGSTKQAFLDATETACYVVYGTEPTDDPKAIESWSVVVTGQLTELSDTDAVAFDTAEINRRFSPIRVFDEAVEDVDVRIIRLDVETMTGRTTPMD
ncbi:pyridoxamine 5'-phosphate oxidase family protein [Halorubrum sp. DTA46]|uniref:pyridoxamine 5'-phosphate oxidase family protein n=1 Tax=Halorubrum sp. DTA46 TaxID=3402162 RepID=UPI003AB0150F